MINIFKKIKNFFCNAQTVTLETVYWFKDGSYSYVVKTQSNRLYYNTFDLPIFTEQDVRDGREVIVNLVDWTEI